MADTMRAVLLSGPVSVYPMERIRDAHTDLENDTGVGKIVVTTA
jgi:hypothetical protein